VGRSAELAALEDERRRRSEAGEFRCVLLVADPGIGKTRLASTFVERRRGRSITLSARAYPLGETAGFGVWSEAFEGYLSGLESDEVSELCGGFLDDLAGLIRSVAAARGAAPDREPPRLRVLEGLAVLLSRLARRRPVVVFLDDAHVADASSWEALDWFARNLRHERVLVVLAARPGELAANETANGIRLALEQEGVLHQLPLSPLDDAALGALAEAVVGAPPPRALRDWLGDRSRGNPLFALGLLRALLEEGADLDAPRLRAIPEGLADRVGRLVGGLDEARRAVLEALAVAEMRVDPADLVAFTGLPVDRLAAALESLEELRLVREESAGRQLAYEIAHPLIQQAIYERIGGARRRSLHRRIARALLAQDRLGEAAPHFARSAAVGDDEAIGALRDAIRQAESRQTYREALTILGTLVELIPEGDPRWLDVLDALSWRAEWVVDHRADTHALLGIDAMRAIDRLLDPSWAPEAQAMVKFRLAHFLGWGAGDLAAAEEACAAAQTLFERAGDGASARLAANELAWIHGLGGDYEAMEAGGQVVGETAEAAGDLFAAIQGFHTQGHAAWIRGRFAVGQAALERSNEIAVDAGKVYRLTVGLISLATCLALQGRVAESLALIEEAKAADPGWRDSIVPEWESILHWYGGNFGSALERAAEAESRTHGGLSKRRVIGVVFAALAAVEAGRPDEARRHIERARSSLGEGRWQFFRDACGHAEDLVAWQEGDTATALSRLRGRAEAILATGAEPFAALALVDTAELAGETADASIAADAAEGLRGIARRAGPGVYAALASLALAWAGLAAGDDGAASESALTAVELLSGTGWAGFRARAAYVLGRSLERTEPAGAVEALAGAVEAFESCGAVWRRDRARAVLVRLGSRGRRAARAASRPELSRREREVAVLAVEGHTARAIGERLFISERTVETHLANVYAKLGVRSKLELVRRAVEFALIP
jgi:DNA-binding CsgD family transcriptional regulator/tetratricopeptide (TPR) repeat protein